MMELRRSSFAFQLALLLGIALLVAQLANLALVLNEQQKLSLAKNEGPAIHRFAAIAADAQKAPIAAVNRLLQERSHRGAYFDLKTYNDVTFPDEERLVRQTVEALKATGVTARDVHIASAPPHQGMGPGGKPFPKADPLDPHKPDPERLAAMQVLHFAFQRPDGLWFTARIYAPLPEPFLTVRLLVATAFLYAVVLVPALWIAARMARPLRSLTRAAEAFGGRGTPDFVEPTGPGDIAGAISAFNAMNRRVVSLLDEKDRMLGAIGHDLRTPLASLRLRLEQMEPLDDRASAIAKIEDMAAILDDILMLARTGRSRSEREAIDLAALVEAVVADEVDLGRPVTFRGGDIDAGDRLLVMGHAGQLRRALSNLIDNAVTYGECALVEIHPLGDRIELSVSDRGQGIPQEELEAVLAPFHRTEPSRNRDSGGSGLGLPIAQSIAESHDGTLRLLPAEERGLKVVLTLPRELPSPARP
ncbi:sensor histidine kinase [Novosphingobium terrae]|uniref:sensor histidine kinase n=1 Tax=Novosphingobium terrae TaxID=2726189 RepID=UPI0019825544|nr:HAMP domain-containing sensor histidine kinase [Novosphingobium terrae]